MRMVIIFGLIAFILLEGRLVVNSSCVFIPSHVDVVDIPVLEELVNEASNYMVPRPVEDSTISE
jgi:hypothetical protein